ncbi:MAG: lipoate--protein ligase [Clostridia bacterium]|nr:lipoate--protein ligase [Clostridia bacterium]
MIIYRNNSTDAYFNLASEQYLLDTKQGDVFMLWRNDRSVIVGKNQNTYAELDVDFVEKNNVKVVRRLTGGGAVFHDKGNVNFTFIVPQSENATLDFERFTRPIINALASLGVEGVCLSGRNDILIDGVKISGNAQSLYNSKTIHHGTLLYNADLTSLVGALRVDEEKIKSKGIKSVRNRVCNIVDFMPEKIDVCDFMDYLEKYVANETGAEIVDFSEEDIKNIRKLADEKYSTWEWNFGQSKAFTADKKKRYPFGSVGIQFSADQGIINQIKIYGDFFGVENVDCLASSMVGARVEKAELEKVLDGELIAKCISGMDKESFIELVLS